MNTDKPSEQADMQRISEDLERLRKTRAESKLDSPAPSAKGAKAAVHFITAMAVCSLLGYGADILLGSLPWGLLAGLLLGVIVGARMMFHDVAQETN